METGQAHGHDIQKEVRTYLWFLDFTVLYQLSQSV